MSIYLDRAHLLMQQGRIDLAEKELTRSLAEEPNNPMAHALQALCVAQREEWSKAMWHVDQAIGFAPDYDFAHHVRGDILLIRNRPDEALVSAKEAVRLDPNQARHHVLIGRIALASEQWGNALDSARHSLALDPADVDARNLEAMALRQLGRRKEAKTQLRDALAQDPDNAMTHANLGWNHLHQGNRKKAMEHFREALRLEPNLESARYGVIETIKAGNPLYRLFLKYILWMSTLTTMGRWMVILGAWLLVQILDAISKSFPVLKPWVVPILGVYIGFVLVSWLAVPMSNLALRLHPMGRLALSDDERLGSNVIGLTILGSMVLGGTWVIVRSDTIGIAALVTGMMVLPLASTCMSVWPWPRKAMIGYTAVTAVTGLGFILGFALKDLDWESMPGLIVLPVLGSLLVCKTAFPWLAFLSLIASNVLTSIRWKS